MKTVFSRYTKRYGFRIMVKNKRKTISGVINANSEQLARELLYSLGFTEDNSEIQISQTA